MKDEGNWIETLGCLLTVCLGLLSLAWVGLLGWGIVELIQWIERQP